MPIPRTFAKLTRDATAQSCARHLLETVPAVMRLVRTEVRREAGDVLSVPQFRALAFLGRNPDTSLSAVSDFIGVADATASAMVDRLVRRGLVLRQGDPLERRRVRLRLTRTGSTLLRRAQARTRRRVAGRLDALDTARLNDLARGLDLLRDVFELPLERKATS